MRGIFLTYGTCRTEEQADQFLNFCRDAGITDIFVQTGLINWGSRVDNVPDLFPYIVSHRGSLNVHAHFTTLRLWRKQNKLAPELRPEIKDEWLYLDPPETIPMQDTNGQDFQRHWMLDPMLPEVQDYLVETCKKVVRDNDIQGLFIDRFYYRYQWSKGQGTQEEKKQNLTALLRRIISECKAIKPAVKVSVATLSDRLQDETVWEGIDGLDHLIPLTFASGVNFDLMFDTFKDKAKYIPALGCHNNTLEETQRQVVETGDQVLFGYEKLSKNNDSKDDFVEAINA